MTDLPHPDIPADAIAIELPITNIRGLHARASAKFVQTVESFPDARIWVSRAGETVGGTSIMGLMMLAAGIGTSIMVYGAGAQADLAIAALAALVTDKFGEGE
jgi:phosphocarrier protein